MDDTELWKQLGGAEDDLTDEIKRAKNEEIANRTKLLDNDIKVNFGSTFLF